MPLSNSHKINFSCSSKIYFCPPSRAIVAPGLEANVTKLRELEYDHEAKICKSIQGNDADALYLWEIMQDTPTSYFSQYKETNNFKPVVSHKYGHLARQLLEWLIFSQNISIKRMFNGKEKRLGPRQLLVDGFCQQTKTVYQLHS